ncbi:Sec-independent protein translocase subunit TatA [Jannaschia sp. R86511]|uniref:Sec-independent protein translocase subunit TatA n=1 Tax=Jannaschia sp. R86511 TaxID=3093853 RepID=UPI0036D21598
MFRNLIDQPFALVIIILAVVVLFGYKRLPDAARQIGRSMRIFKSEVKTMKDEGGDKSKAAPKPGPADDETEPLEGRVITDDHAPRVDPLDEPRRTDPARHDA